MGLTVSASLNIFGNPLIYGESSYQTGLNNPVIPNALYQRIAIDNFASDVVINITPVYTGSPINVSATNTYNAVHIASIEGSSDYTITIDSSGAHITNASGAITDFNFSAGTPLGFIFNDSTAEQHTVYVMKNDFSFTSIQTSGTNTIVETYTQNGSPNTFNPLTNYGQAQQGLIDYQYSLNDGTDYTDIGSSPPTSIETFTLDNAYPSVTIKAIWTIQDVNNNVIFQGILTNSPFAMTDEVPTQSVSLSDLTCNCTSLTVTDATTYQNRLNWYVAVFTRVIVSATPYYKGAEKGNDCNVAQDNSWTIFVPFNGAYTERWIAIYRYVSTVTYSLNDWVFNPIDNKLYISNTNSNNGNALTDLVNWRQWNVIQDLQTVFSKTSDTGGHYLYDDLGKNVTCNTSPPVNIRNEKSCISSCSTLALGDTTGMFDFAHNPYGYGAPNYPRDQYANVYFLVNERSTGTVVYLTANGYNPLSGMIPTFNIVYDGSYRLYMYQVSLYNTTVGFRYQKNQTVYEPTAQVYYKSLVNNNTQPLTNSMAWVGISTWSDFATTTNFGNWQWDYLVTCNGYKTLNDIGLGIISETCAPSCQDELYKKRDLVSIYLRGACDAFAVYDFATAQCLLESVPKNCAPYLGGINSNYTKGCC